MPTPPRLAWITGASSGIGRALALHLARDGWRVAASARNADALAALAAASPGIVPVPLDVTDERAVAAAVAAIEDAHGPIALAVLNAGTHEAMGAEDFSAAPLRRLIDLNLMGVANALAALLPRMRARRAGHIAVVASLAGYRGLPTAAAYGASKAAVIVLCEALKPDCDRLGITLQLVNPGFVATPLTARNRFTMPFLMPLERATAAFARGLRSRRFEIVFPWRFAMLMKLLRLLPYRLYFAVVRRMTGG
jgi:NAD(P)-dependent dehydrogenase (short-subunit alcohol dehydrogenase family)